MRRWSSHQEMQRELSRGQDVYRKGANALGSVTSETKMKWTPEVTAVTTSHFPPPNHPPVHHISIPYLLIDLHPPTNLSCRHLHTCLSVHSHAHLSIYPDTRLPTESHVLPSVHPFVPRCTHLATYSAPTHCPWEETPRGRQGWGLAALDALDPL